MVDIHAIILAGGSGTRFWPLSRETLPKQMLKIVGEDTLILQTIKRVSGVIPPENIWIVTTKSQAQDIRFHIDSLGPLSKNIRLIIEPFGKNTAPAIGLSAIHINQFSSKESITVVMPSDHLIPDTENFISDLNIAIEAAKNGYLVTFGIRPTRPETGYGYIKCERRYAEDIKILKVERFVEKPDLKTAEAYLLDGNYYWNSGIFVWKNSKILSEIEAYLPNLHNRLKEIESLLIKSPESPLFGISKKLENENYLLHIDEIYSQIESISIDYGVMEKSRDVMMVKASFRWSDLGSFTALDEVIDKDENGNIFRGNLIDIGSKNTTILSGEKLIATIGLNDMVVVDTPDATLISPKANVQEVRKIVELLKKKGREEYLCHKRVERPWGSYTILDKGNGYKIKRIIINPGSRLSLQVHKKRSEHWVVISGTAKVTRNDETFFVKENQSTYIPQNTKHRLENPGSLPLQIIEVQNGEYLEEDDIERLEDDYGRAKDESF